MGIQIQYGEVELTVKALDLNLSWKSSEAQKISYHFSRWWQLKMATVFILCIRSIFWALAYTPFDRFWIWHYIVSEEWRFPQLLNLKFSSISYCSLKKWMATCNFSPDTYLLFLCTSVGYLFFLNCVHFVNLNWKLWLGKLYLFVQINMK